VGVGPGFDGWFPGEPRRRRELVNPICREVLQAREYEADYLASVLPGLADFPINRVAELTPTAWAVRN
jgi:hypothetical protein